MMEGSDTTRRSDNHTRPYQGGVWIGLASFCAAIVLIYLEVNQFSELRREQAEAVVLLQSQLAGVAPASDEAINALRALAPHREDSLIAWIGWLEGGFRCMLIFALLFFFSRSKAGHRVSRAFVRFWTWRPR